MLAGMLAVAPVATTIATPVVAFAETIAENPSESVLAENAEGDTITRNDGTVTDNEGAITQNWGTVTENNGEIVHNMSTGNVVENTEAGTISYNLGSVGTNNGIITTNQGTIEENNTTLDCNSGSGVIETNNSTVRSNSGTISDNDGSVTNNHGTILDNADGTVEFNQNGGTVTGGVVVSNKGNVTGEATVTYNYSGLGATLSPGIVPVYDYFMITMGDYNRWTGGSATGDAHDVTAIYCYDINDELENVERFVNKNSEAYISAKNYDLEYLSNVEVGSGEATLTQVSQGIWKISGITGNVTLIPTYIAKIIENIVNTPVKEEATKEEKVEKAEEIKIVEEFLASTPEYTQEEAAAVVEQIVELRQEVAKQVEEQAIKQATAEVKVEDIKVAAVDETGAKLAVAIVDAPVTAAKNQMVSACAEIKQAVSGNKEAMKVFTEAGIDVSKIDTTKAKVVSSVAVAMPKEGTVTLDIAANTIKDTDTVIAVFTDAKGKRYYAPIKINKNGKIIVKIPVKNCTMSLIKF